VASGERKKNFSFKILYGMKQLDKLDLDENIEKFCDRAFPDYQVFIC